MTDKRPSEQALQTWAHSARVTAARKRDYVVEEVRRQLAEKKGASPSESPDPAPVKPDEGGAS